jgi:hypothetical protein
MVHTSIVIGALAIAATASVSTPQPAGALALRGGQTELINRPDARHQHCWADGGHGRFRNCEGGFELN